MITLHKIFKKWNCGRVGQGSGLKIHLCRFDSYWFHGSGSSPDGSPTAVGLSQGLITLQGVVTNGGGNLSPFFKNFILPTCEVPAGAMQLCRLTAQLPLMYPEFVMLKKRTHS